jgi:hypothetical protein
MGRWHYVKKIEIFSTALRLLVLSGNMINQMRVL